MVNLDEKIRILYVISSLEVGGAERVVVDLVNGLDPRYFEPAICCLRRSGTCAERIQRDATAVIEMNHGEGNDPSLPIRMSQIIRSKGIDLVHSHGWGTFCEAVAAARLGGATVMVHTAHGRRDHDVIRPTFFTPWKRAIRHRVERFFMRWVDQLVVVSEYQKSPLARDLRLEASRITTLINGITFLEGPIRYEEKRRELGLAESDLLICSVGRLAEVKNFPLLLEATADVIRQVPQARLIVVGDGPERHTLEETRRRLDLESVVTFLGERNDVLELLAVSDLFVLPSNFEATSMALLEAMGAGLPVIATNVGGTPFIVSDQETGRLIPSQDRAALSKQIITLLQDPVSRRDMGRKGAEKVRTLFSKERMLKDHERLYLRLLDEKREFRPKASERIRA